MLTFLKFVAAIVVAIVISAVLLYLWIRWKLSNFQSMLGSKFAEAFEKLGAEARLGGVPPLRIKLMRLEGHEFSNADKVDEWSQSMESASFQSLGDYEIEPAMAEARAFHHPNTGVFGVVYEHPMMGVGMDFYCVTRDRRQTFTYTTVEASGMMDRPPGHDLVVITELTTPAKAYERFLAERPQADWDRVSAADFIPLYQQSYADVMDWRIARGGPSPAEVRRIAQHDGGEVTDETVRRIRKTWMRTAADFYDEQLKETFMAGQQMSGKEWSEAEYRLFFVHARSQAEDLLNHISRAQNDDDENDEADEDLDWDERIEQIEQRLAGTTPRQLFADLLRERGLAGRFESRGRMQQPIEADVYLAPPYDD